MSGTVEDPFDNSIDKSGWSPNAEPVEIDASMLHQAVDFEKGMSCCPIFSILMMILCTATFAIQFAGGSLDNVDDLIDVGALDIKPVLNGEMWRLVSATFMHAGLDHLVGNVVMLYILGMACEHGFGRSQFLFLYVLSGVVGSLFSLLGGTTSVGASGAIFGLAGAIVVLFWRHRNSLHLRDRRIGIVLAFWACYQLFLGTLTPGIDNLAHVGGVASGSLLAFALSPAVVYGRETVSKTLLARVGLMASCLCLAVTAVFFIPRLLASI